MLPAPLRQLHSREAEPPQRALSCGKDPLRARDMAAARVRVLLLLENVFSFWMSELWEFLFATLLLLDFSPLASFALKTRRRIEPAFAADKTWVRCPLVETFRAGLYHSYRRANGSARRRKSDLYIGTIGVQGTSTLFEVRRKNCR